MQNLFDAVLWATPETNPTNTNFGKATGATNSIIRFFTFVWKVNFCCVGRVTLFSCMVCAATEEF